MSESEVVTEGIRVHVRSAYAPERSRPLENQWFFIYTIRISNEGTETVQLLRRHWIITDANGRVEEVEGPGVVGEQPVLAPGQSFEYTSACPLGTRFGTMHGSYTMVRRRDRSEFPVEVAPFALSEPHAIN